MLIFMLCTREIRSLLVLFDWTLLDLCDHNVRVSDKKAGRKSWTTDKSRISNTKKNWAGLHGVTLKYFLRVKPATRGCVNLLNVWLVVNFHICVSFSRVRILLQQGELNDRLRYS